MGKQSTIGAVCAIHLFLCSTASAANFSFTGAFSADDDVQLFNFTTDGSSLVTLSTTGYGGDGGFSPMLTVFDSTDNVGVGVNTDGSAVIDASFTSELVAGDYTVALTQYGNFALGPAPSDGFVFQGAPNFTNFFETDTGCSNGMFCANNINGISENRTNLWALDIINVANASVVPVPAAVWLFGSGLLGLIAVARRYKA